MEKKELLVSFLIIFFIVHLIFSYVMGSFSPSDFNAAGRFVEIVLVVLIFSAYIK